MVLNRPAVFSLSSIFLLIALIGVLLGLMLPSRPEMHGNAAGLGTACVFCGVPIGIVFGARQRKRARGMLCGALVGLIVGIAAAIIFAKPPGLMAVVGGGAVLLVTAAVFRNRG